MVATNPDKYIRKAVYDLVNGITVGPYVVNCYDTRIPNSADDQRYILLTSQTKDISKANKCEYRWETSLLIEIYTRYPGGGNYGSRLELNDIENAVYNELADVGNYLLGGYKILTQNISFETQLETVTSTEIIYRSFLRLNLTLI